ncbi:hypothetical protein DIPPA_20611 [Diplonema papillatum]|nr:hypothetical protein DIPPA_20611 [Diplonema papillatum]
MDLAFNGPFKSHMRERFSSWFQKKFCKAWKKGEEKARQKAEQGEDPEQEAAVSDRLIKMSQKVKTGTKDIRDIHFQWIHKAFTDVPVDSLRASFGKSGIIQGDDVNPAADLAMPFNELSLQRVCASRFTHAVVNTDPSDKAGTHWIAISSDREDKQVRLRRLKI